MRHYVFILLLIISTESKSQTLDKETFVNQVYKTLVDTSFPYYQLSNEAYRLSRNDLNISTNVIPDSILKQIIDNYCLDTLKGFWDVRKLAKAKSVNKDSIGIITGSTTRIYSLDSWSKRRKLKEEKKQMQQQYEQREKKPLYEKRVYFFSKPVFDKAKKYAIITMSYGCGLTCGYGCCYIFKFIDNKWKMISTTQCWVS